MYSIRDYKSSAAARHHCDGIVIRVSEAAAAFRVRPCVLAHTLLVVATPE
jgi:hypothetical protein